MNDFSRMALKWILAYTIGIASGMGGFWIWRMLDQPLLNSLIIGFSFAVFASCELFIFMQE